MNYLALGITNTVNYQTQKPLSEQADLEMAPDSFLWVIEDGRKP